MATTSTRSSKTSGKSVFSSFKWESFDKMFDEAFTPRGSIGSSETGSSRRRSLDPNRHSDTRSKPAVPPTTDPAPVPPNEGEFDRLWNDARRVRKTTTTRKRVVTRSSDSADTDPEVDEMGQLRPRGQTRHVGMDVRSFNPPDSSFLGRSSFTETEHNGIINLVFELPGIPKSDIKKVTVEEKAEGERLIRERVEKKYLRTIPIPPAVPFDCIRAVLQDERLTVTYPRVDILK
ncbi:heat shock protein HSP20-like chaperone [Rhizoctonia solani]|uniref:Heat shock protein HSP20-like chaperone n=1 Tax=Rhizoctonia solani TaxID=456999 RepID=A0A8H8NQX1_9AGAM|nr:heat shock protein HSP20-like chaperone [Rhizoctonia solani]QRW17860.1 heat shock protein HSP20-like chaperone [Rhizoctonia solani]